jgi:hypothetical protein
MAFSKLKTLLRKQKARTYDHLWRAVGKVCDLFIPQECKPDVLHINRPTL